MSATFWKGVGTGALGAVALVLGIQLAGSNGRNPVRTQSLWDSPDRLAWHNGSVQDAAGNRLSVACLSGSLIVTLSNVGRLEPQDSESVSINRMIGYRFDNGAEQQARGGLEDERLQFRQWETGVDTNYDQDLIAEMIRNDHRTLTIRTTDGANRPLSWTFNIAGARTGLREEFQRCRM